MGCLSSLLLAFLTLPPEGAEPPLPRALAQDPPVRLFDRFDPQDEGPPAPRRLEPYRRPADPENPEAWAILMSFEVRSIRGSTKVREDSSHPAHLNLAEDLGFGAAPGLRFQLVRDTSSLRFFLEVEMAHGAGRDSVPGDFAYDEGHFKGGAPFTTTVDLFFARAGVAFKDLGVAVDGGWIAPFLALEYPRISLSIHQPSTGESTGEQYKQLIPYPIVGLLARIALDDSFTLEGRAYAGWLPDTPTPFLEGSRLYFSVRTLAAEAELRWKLTGGVSLTLGGGISSWAGHLSSNEDGNRLKLVCPEATLGLEIRF